MYYIIDREYVGPDSGDDQYVDSQTITISTHPATALDGTAVVSGHCATLAGYMTYAHGEYATAVAARAAVTAMYGETRIVDPIRTPLEYSEEGVVAIYKPGRYEPMSRMATSMMLDNSDITVTADITDEQIEQMVEDTVDEFRLGAELDPDPDEIRKSLKNWRDERISEAKEG